MNKKEKEEKELIELQKAFCLEITKIALLQTKCLLIRQLPKDSKEYKKLLKEIEKETIIWNKKFKG